MTRLPPPAPSRLAALLLVALLLAGCTTSTSITAPGSPLEQATEVAPTPNAITPAAPDESATTRWSDYQLDSYRIGFPRGWKILGSTADIDDLVAAVGPDAAEGLAGYRALFANGDGVVGLGDLGDNPNVFRTEGSNGGVSEPDLIERAFKSEFASIAELVEVRATPRLFGDQAGMSVYAHYVTDEQVTHMYQFSTEHDGDTFYFTLTLLSGADQALADAFFDSIVFR